MSLLTLALIVAATNTAPNNAGTTTKTTAQTHGVHNDVIFGKPGVHCGKSLDAVVGLANVARFRGNKKRPNIKITVGQNIVL